MTEVLLTMAIVAIAAPFLYSQIADATHNLRDLAMAKNIIELRADVLNFIRINQDSWPKIAQIKLSEEELDTISQMPTAGFIDKYAITGGTMTDVYLAFDLQEDLLRTNKVMRQIGSDAATVGADGIAYGDNWAVAAPDFKAGNLIYRISRDVSGEDKSKFLHRAAADDGLYVMQRNLMMGGFDVFNIGTVIAKSAKVQDVSVRFLSSDVLSSDNVYFPSGANLDGAGADIGALRITDDMSGFRDIFADSLNGKGFGTTGRIIASSAKVLDSVNVANDMVVKSESGQTVSGFAGMSANSVKTPYLSAQELIFLEDFGLTVSGELTYSTTAPIRIGSWVFPSYSPPSFSSLTFTRAQIPEMPNSNNFDSLMKSGWKDVPQKASQ